MLRKRKPSEDDTDPDELRPKKRARTGEYTPSHVGASPSFFATTIPFTGSTKNSKAPELDNTTSLGSQSMRRPIIDKHAISPFDILMSAPEPSASLAGFKRDGSSKRKMAESEDDNAEFEALPKKRARVVEDTDVPPQVSADVPVASAGSSGTPVEEKASELDIG